MEALFSQSASHGGIFKVHGDLCFSPVIDFLIVHFIVMAFIRFHDTLMAALRESSKSFIFQQGSDTQKCARHHCLFHNLYTVGRILVIGGAFLYAAIYAPQHAESHADHGLCFRKNLHNACTFEAIGTAKAHNIRFKLFGALNDFVAQAHLRHSLPLLSRCL